MTHLKGFGLENFRVFKEHTWFDFAPITLLIGPNSSGKSSLTKGLWSFKNILNGDFEFKKDEALLQLGNFERIINKESNKKKLVYSTSYLLNHYPTLGETKNIQFFIEFIQNENSTRISIEKFYFKMDEQILYEHDNSTKKARFNIFLFKKMLVIDTEKIKVQNSEIVDIKQERLSFMNYPLGKREFGRKLFQSDEMDLNDIVEIYSKKVEIDNEFFEIPTKYTVIESQGFQNADGEYEIYRYENEELDEEPLKSVLLKSGFSRNQSNFINQIIFEFPKFFKSIENSFNDLEYHFNLKGNVQRIYRRIEDDYFNNLLGSFFAKNIDEKAKSFLNQSSKKFNLQGEIKPIYDKKYDTQTLEVGLPLIEQGFGISQIVATLIKIVTMNGEKLICEEPEANLHPAFQSKLADMFDDASKTFNQQFIIETHSEYMVRKFQYLVAKGEMKKEDIVIYYFHDPNNVPEGEKQVKKIEILEDGSLSDDFGTGFFDEAANWELELLRIKRNKIRQN